VAAPTDSEQKKIEKKEETTKKADQPEEDSNRDGSPIKGRLGDVADKGENTNPKAGGADANVEQDVTKKAANQKTTNGQADTGATQETAGESQENAQDVTTAGDVLTSEEAKKAEKLQRKRRKSADAGITSLTGRTREGRVLAAAHWQAWDFKEKNECWWNDAGNNMGPAVMTTSLLNNQYPTGSEVYSVKYKGETYANKSNKQEAVEAITNALSKARDAREEVKLQLLDATAVGELSKQKIERLNSNPNTRDNTPANSVTPAVSVAPVLSPAPNN